MFIVQHFIPLYSQEKNLGLFLCLGIPGLVVVAVFKHVLMLFDGSGLILKKKEE